MKRRLYFGAATVLAVIAALLTLHAQHTVPVVVATHNLHAGAMVASDDVQVVSMHSDSVPPGALGSVDETVGRYVAWPLTSGEPLIAGSLTSSRSGGAAVAGLDIPTGYSAVAVPVQPAAAVGGMLSPGDRVDVYATPLHADSSAPADGAAFDQATLVGHDVLVIQLRTDQGQPLDGSDAAAGGSTVHGLNFGSGKLGSVVLAVPDADVPSYASAISNKVMYLSLSVG